MRLQDLHGAGLEAAVETQPMNPILTDAQTDSLNIRWGLSPAAERGERYRFTAQHILDLMRGAGPETCDEQIALAAVGMAERIEMLEAILCASVALTVEKDQTIDDLRERERERQRG
ncbi:MAG: hypothetical protein ABI051_03345 [Vicinamibacterales bacterium]